MKSQIILDAIHNAKIVRTLIWTNERYTSYYKIKDYHKCSYSYRNDCRKCAFIKINSEIKRLEETY